MDRILAVPNFSTPIPPELCGLQEVTLHYNRGDIDHGRTVVAISGETQAVIRGMMDLVGELFARIDLRDPGGVHPRIGALDVAPFVDLEGTTAREAAEEFAALLRETTGVRTIPYERNAPADATRALPDLRRDPAGGHPRYGATVYGARDFLIAANLDFPSATRESVRRAARELRRRRNAGDPALTGVRALAFDLTSRDEVQLSFNLTRPDQTTFDAVAAIGEALVEQRASGTELIGVIRPRDLPGATRLSIDPMQIAS